jgi:hypothetical protein
MKKLRILIFVFFPKEQYAIRSKHFWHSSLLFKSVAARLFTKSDQMMLPAPENFEFSSKWKKGFRQKFV